VHRWLPMNKQRIESLSDGVFAVAMTLLVFGFKAGGGGTSVRLHLVGLWPQLLSYILSFVIVGVYWVAHHTLFHFVAKANRTLLWCNNLFLMTIAFLPFPASLLGEYPSSHTSIALYGCTLILSNTALTLNWICASRAKLLDPTLPSGFSKFGALITFAPALVYGLAVVISFANVTIPLVLFAAVPAFFIVPHKLVEGRVAKATSGSARAG
jgi:uncharacterized membrane protein